MKRLTVLFLAVFVIGCAGGRSSMDTGGEEGAEGEQAFVFVESGLIDIDSDLIAEYLGDKQRAGQKPDIDSTTVTDIIYEIFLDSLLGREAAEFDLSEGDPRLYHQYRELREDRVMRLMFDRIIVDSVTVSDSVIDSIYRAQKDQYLIPDQYRARHIVMAGEGLKSSEDSALYSGMDMAQLDSLARSTIEDIRRRLVAGASFDTLAMMYSQDAYSSEKGGDLGYFELSSMVHPFDSTVENTPIGEFSGIIKTQYGYHVVKVEDFSPAHYLPLDSVYQQIKNRAMEQAVAERSRVFMDSLRENSTIILDTAALMMDDSLHGDWDAMAYVNPDDTVYGNDTVIFKEYNSHVYSYKKFKNIEGALSFDDKAEILDAVATKKMLLQAARKFGYYSAPEIEEWAQGKMHDYSVATLRKRVKQSDYEPSEEEMKAYYDSHIDDYQVERPYKVRHIVFEDSNLAVHVRDLLMSGYDFMEMVDKYYPGDPDIRRAAADLGNIGPNDMPHEFYSMAKRTPVGKISYPVKTEYGYHLIEVLEKAPSTTYESAKPRIRALLKKRELDEKIKDYVDSRLGSEPVIYWELMDDLYFEQFPVRVSRPNMFPPKR